MVKLLSVEFYLNNSYRTRVTDEAALALCGDSGLPLKGFKRVVAKARFEDKLYLALLGGQPMLFSNEFERHTWGTIFGVSIKEESKC